MADVYIKIGLYKFNGTQKLEIPVKAQPCGVYIGVSGNKLWKSGTNSTGHPSVTRLFYYAGMASNSSSLYTKPDGVAGWAIKNGNNTEEFAFEGILSDNPPSGNEVFKNPIYSNGLFKIDLTGSDYYFNMMSGSGGRVQIIVLYPASTQGTYYNSNIE